MAIVFAFHTFEKPPLLFQRNDLARIQAAKAEYIPVEARYDAAFVERRQAALEIIDARRQGDPEARARGVARYRRAQREFDSARGEGIALARKINGGGDYNDTNYIFLTFVTRYLPAGVVGLIMAAIFAAAMSTISSDGSSTGEEAVFSRHLPDSR